MKSIFSLIVILTALICSGSSAFARQPASAKKQDTLVHPRKFGFGRTATNKEIALWDIDVRPDGKGLPAGQGDVLKGKALYTLKCAMCHGQEQADLAAARFTAPVLFSDTSTKSRPKAIGNYWPYATTLFDYVRRTMPYNQPGSLSDNEVYSITAYLLNANKIIKQDQVLNAKNLPKIVMPAKKLFVRDDRKGGPEVK
ncbi:MAG: cytochrome c [Bacteroidota bacterium]